MHPEPIAADAERQRSAALLGILRSTKRIQEHRRRIAQLIVEAHELGASWVELGEVLGITRQAARRRFEGNRSAAEGGSSDA